jgi:tricorn protease
MIKKITCAVILLAGSFFTAQAQDSPSWLRYSAISPDGTTIVFTYKGDLFKVPAAGGTAVPLTLHEAHDFMPVWSHDG